MRRRSAGRRGAPLRQEGAPAMMPLSGSPARPSPSGRCQLRPGAMSLENCFLLRFLILHSHAALPSARLVLLCPLPPPLAGLWWRGQQARLPNCRWSMTLRCGPSRRLHRCKLSQRQRRQQIRQGWPRRRRRWWLLSPRRQRAQLRPEGAPRERASGPGPRLLQAGPAPARVTLRAGAAARGPRTAPSAACSCARCRACGSRSCWRTCSSSRWAGKWLSV